MTTAQLTVAYAYESTLENLTGIKQGIEHGVKQAIANHHDSVTEEFNSANRAQLEQGKPGCLD